MGAAVVCHFCLEYRDCFKVVHKNGQEQFNMCYKCAYNYQGADVWREVNERMEVNV